MIHLKTQLNKYRKQYNDIIHKVQAENSLLDALKDEVRDLELESRRPNLEDSPQTRKIRNLENRLDKAMIKFNEAQSIRKTYEQIVKRLREERIGFDNQLAAIERTLAAKNHDYEELMLLSSDANHAKDMTLQELERVRSNYEEERRNRDKQLKEKAQIVQIKADMQTRLEKRDKEKKTLIARESANLSVQEQNTLKSNAALNAPLEERKEHRTKIDIFESAFRKIKDATGVSDVNEVIQKIFNQEGTTENLMMVSRENQSRIDQMQKEKQRLKSSLEELKYSGSGSGHRRKLVDDHEENLTVAATKLERVRLKYERLATILISSKAGVEHLADKMEAVQDSTQPIPITDDNIVTVLHQIEQTMVSLLAEMQSGQEEKLKLSPVKPSAPPTTEFADMEITDGDMTNTRPFNQRIPLPTSGVLQDDAENEEEAAVEEFDDALSRDKVKKASTQILLAQDKKKKRQTKEESGANRKSPKKIGLPR